MGPTQFRTQCVANWERHVERSHVSQIRNIESSAKFPAERFPQDWQQPSSVHSSRGAALFKLNDMPANLPAGLDLDSVDGPQSLLTGDLESVSECYGGDRQYLGLHHPVCIDLLPFCYFNPNFLGEAAPTAQITL